MSFSQLCLVRHWEVQSSPGEHHAGCLSSQTRPLTASTVRPLPSGRSQQQNQYRRRHACPWDLGSELLLFFPLCLHSNSQRATLKQALFWCQSHAAPCCLWDRGRGLHPPPSRCALGAILWPNGPSPPGLTALGARGKPLFLTLGITGPVLPSQPTRF